MTTSKDFVRQASLFTMGGLTDPRLMPGYEGKKTPTQTHSFSFMAALRRSVEGFKLTSLIKNH